MPRKTNDNPKVDITYLKRILDKNTTRVAGLEMKYGKLEKKLEEIEKEYEDRIYSLELENAEFKKKLNHKVDLTAQRLVESTNTIQEEIGNIKSTVELNI